jgi:hypothetical protein
MVKTFVEEFDHLVGHDFMKDMMTTALQAKRAVVESTRGL